MSRASDLTDLVRAARHLPAPDLRRAIRIGAGVSQNQVAVVCGVDRATVSRWESGQRFPRGEHLLTYVQLLRDIQRAASE